MTIYARSDIASVGVSPEHGGCGRTHTRPVVNGEPVAVFALDCPQCESHLSKDSLWSRYPSEIPETPDEARERGNGEKNLLREQRAATAAALTQLGKLGGMSDALAQLASLMAEAQSR